MARHVNGRRLALAPAAERWISLGEGTAPLPERLLLAHAAGEILFITGAGTSMPSGLPDFKNLVLQVYRELDPQCYSVISIDPNARSGSFALNHSQSAEVKRFDDGDYDVVLGMLERRVDGTDMRSGKVRATLTKLIRTNPFGGALTKPKPAQIHRALMKLADRGQAVSIATTNFDHLLQAAGQRRIETHVLGGIPRPSTHSDFSGVMHIHGALSFSEGKASDFVVTDRDFGEFYLRRRVVPDFIYDAARLFNLVLVGYSANDAPMRYLLNAVAADGSRFRDLKERFAFIAAPSIGQEVHLEDWRGRGITPIPYDSRDGHRQLETTLTRWAELSAVNGKPERVAALIRKLVKNARESTPEGDRDLFDHLFRRSNDAERQKIAEQIAVAGANIDWLSAMNLMAQEVHRESAR